MLVFAFPAIIRSCSSGCFSIMDATASVSSSEVESASPTCMGGMMDGLEINGHFSPVKTGQISEICFS